MNVRCRLALSIDILKFIRVFEGHCKEESGGGGEEERRVTSASLPTPTPLTFFCATNYSLRLSHYLKAWKRQP